MTTFPQRGREVRKRPGHPSGVEACGGGLGGPSLHDGCSGGVLCEVVALTRRGGGSSPRFLAVFGGRSLAPGGVPVVARPASRVPHSAVATPAGADPDIAGTAGEEKIELYPHHGSAACGGRRSRRDRRGRGRARGERLSPFVARADCLLAAAGIPPQFCAGAAVELSDFDSVLVGGERDVGQAYSFV